MKAKIEFIEHFSESVLPIIKLTKSKSGKTGTACFLFLNPKTLEKSKVEIIPLIGMSLLWNEKKIINTTDLNIFFSQGKPIGLKAIFIFKNSHEWFEFLSFMTYYSKETGLSFSEKNSSF